MTVFWRMTLPLSVAAKEFPEEFKKRVTVRKRDRIALVYDNGKPVLTAPATGSTYGQVLRSLEKGLGKPLTTEDVYAVYVVISRFFHRADRLRLIKKFESGKLTARDLIRDNYEFFEGNLKRGKGGVWVYASGS